MASSGWQGNQEFPYPNNDLKCNLRIDSITHSGTNLRVVGAVGAVCANNSPGWYAYYSYPVYVTPEGGSQQTLLSANEQVYGDGTGGLSSAKTVSFDVTLSGVPASDTSYSFAVSINMNNGQSAGTLHWTIVFDASTPTYTAPSGLVVSLSNSTWNSVSGAVSITSYGVPADAPGRYIEFGVCDASATQYAPAIKKFKHSSEGATYANVDITNSETGNFILRGCKHYKIGGFAYNTQLSAEIISTSSYYLPPSPLTSITAIQDYGAPGSIGTARVSCVITGGSSTDNESVNVTTYYRYKIGSGSFSVWSTLGSDKTWVARTVPTILVPYGSTLTVQAKQTYQSQDSEILEQTFNIIHAPLYGSVNGVSVPLAPTYGSVGGASAKLLKLYSSVNGQAVLIHETDT